ncbi:Methionine adenosyltransferase 2 subunit beta [Rhizophlyctis rosea]|uniref:Methionine adenosyltransferase 2 subunit beta n=1 Tax=Rhizophlyctis rosea TaxID=64517 RepID=A0AAD5SKW6_9FUNG|nr:Methionine adenosyltransferase 2 subunit beta [Rhizophlyctis rosea]
MPLIVSSVPRVIVTGASGLLGRAVYKVFREGGYDVVGTAFTRAKDGLERLDLTDFEAVTKFVSEQKSQLIIHCAAERRPDVAERDNAAALKLNVQSSEHLARAAQQAGSAFIYISTDYVFDGTSPPYNVDDKPNPLQFYGRSKYEGEVAIQNVNPNAIILRVPILYGEVEYNAESAVNILLDVVRDKNKKTNMDDVQVRFPTHVEDVGRVLKQIADRITIEQKQVSGVYHYSAKEQFTKYGICEVIAKADGSDISHITRITEAPKEPVASRPNNAQLSTTRLEQEKFDVSHVKFEQWWKDIIKSSAKKDTGSEEVLEKLDMILVAMMDLVDEYTALQESCGKLLNGAFFNLAQAKYAIGPSRLTQYQYDLRMQSSAIIETNEADAETTFTLERKKPTANKPSSVTTEKKNTDSLRQRTNRGKTEDETTKENDPPVVQSEAGASKPTETKKSERKGPIEDPLNWFGVLVPTPLRTAQTEFRQGLNTMVALANVARRLNELCNKYDKLQRSR